MIEIIPNWHPFLVHFTIALFFTATVFFIAERVFAGKAWAGGLLTAGRWNLWLGAVVTLGTIAAGYYAYNTVAHDTPSHAAMTDHRNWAVLTAIALIILAFWSFWARKKEASIIFIALLVVATGALGVTGFKGGEAVYRYGLGVMSLPESEGEGHAHEHAAGEEHDTPATTDGDADAAAKAQAEHDATPHEHGDEDADAAAKAKAEHDATPHEHPGEEQTGMQSEISPEGEAVKSVLLAYNSMIDAADIAGLEQYVVASEAFSIIEGGHANWGWVDYRDNHLAPELNSPDFELVSYRLSNIKVTTGSELSYAVYDYELDARVKGEEISRQGMGTAILQKTEAGEWKIIHLQTS